MCMVCIYIGEIEPFSYYTKNCPSLLVCELFIIYKCKDKLILIYASSASIFSALSVLQEWPNIAKDSAIVHGTKIFMLCHT